VIDVTSIDDFATMSIYFEDGTPEGHDIVEAGLSVDPYFL